MQKVFWKKEGTLEAPKSIQKNEHMKAHKKKLAKFKFGLCNSHSLTPYLIEALKLDES